PIYRAMFSNTLVPSQLLHFTDPPPAEISTLSLHDALPIFVLSGVSGSGKTTLGLQFIVEGARRGEKGLLYSFEEAPDRLVEEARSEEHTSELQSRSDLVCRLLLEKKNTRRIRATACIGELR